MIEAELSQVKTLELFADSTEKWQEDLTLYKKKGIYKLGTLRDLRKITTNRITITIYRNFVMDKRFVLSGGLILGTIRD